MKLQKYAFTLVELIVVITILAILATISFISLQWFAKDARNSARSSDITSIEKVLELYKTRNWEYPEPSNSDQIKYLWAEVWTKWTFWEETRKSLWQKWQISEVPTDPLTTSEYSYSVLNTNKEYQIAITFEWDYLWQNNNNLLNQTYAAWSYGTTYVKWSYNWQVVKVQTWWTTYVLATPSIISWYELTATTNLVEIIKDKKLVYNKSNILPASYANTTDFEETLATDSIVNIWSVVIYETTNINDLTQESNQQELIDNLQLAYSWTLLENDETIKEIVNRDSQINEIYLSQKIIKKAVLPRIEITVDKNAPSCLVLPSSQNWVFIVWSPNSPNTLWQNSNSNSACYYECDSWFSLKWWICLPNTSPACVQIYWEWYWYSDHFKDCCTVRSIWGQVDCFDDSDYTWNCITGSIDLVCKHNSCQSKYWSTFWYNSSSKDCCPISEVASDANISNWYNYTNCYNDTDYVWKCINWNNSDDC